MLMGNSLVSRKILTLEKETLYCNHQVILDPIILSQALAKSIDLFTNNDHEGKFNLEWLTNGVTEMGYEALCSLQKEYAEKARSIVSKFPGGKTVVHGGLIFSPDLG